VPFCHANNTRSPGISRHFRHGIEIILRFQIGNLLLAANQVDLTVSPVAAMFCSQNIGINGLVCAMERAKAEMHNARNQFATIIRGNVAFAVNSWFSMERLVLLNETVVH
jgi:hypothetical protein